MIDRGLLLAVVYGLVALMFGGMAMHVYMTELPARAHYHIER